MNHHLRPYVHKPRVAPSTTYSPAQISAAYNFPTNLPAGGVIAIIELGGGYVPADIRAFCEKFDVPMPTLVDVPCDAGNSPGTDADMEVALDIQIAAGVFSYCTGQPASIRVYWATDIKPAVEKIVADKQAGVPIAAVSISWGAPEDQWTAPQDPQSEDQAIAALAPLGIPFFAAAGDNDSGDGESGKHVDFPASSPHAIGCGGTSKPIGGAETVWNDGPGEGTGGGFSSVFPPQLWQVGAPPGALVGATGDPGRMVPDVAANADPATGYEVYCKSQGGWQVAGGTSAVSPLFAGLFAAINPPLAIASELATELWSFQSGFTDITQGSNGGFSAAVGPDPCTGLGVPNAASWAAVFGSIKTPPPPPAPPLPPAPPAPPAPEPPVPQPPEGGHHHHRHPGHGHHGPHHGKHGGRHWFYCSFPRENRSAYILAEDGDEAKKKFLRSIGVVGSVHAIHVGERKDHEPATADWELEERLSEVPK